MKVIRACAMLSFLVLLSAFVPDLSAQPGYGQPGYRPPPGNWQYLGEANVDGNVDHDRIKVGQGRGVFRAIQMRVENAAIRFDRVIVRYGNGQQVPISIASTIKAGQATRVIDLPGQQRYIDSVEFYYGRGNFNNNRKPKVRLFGIR